MKVEIGGHYYCREGLFTKNTLVEAINENEEEVFVKIKEFLTPSRKNASAKIGQIWPCPKSWLTPIKSVPNPNLSFLSLKEKGIKR